MLTGLSWSEPEKVSAVAGNLEHPPGRRGPEREGISPRVTQRRWLRPELIPAAVASGWYPTPLSHPTKSVTSNRLEDMNLPVGSRGPTCQGGRICNVWAGGRK